MKTKTLKKAIALISMILLFTSFSYSQQAGIRRNSFYIELGGDAFFASLNCECKLINSKNLDLNGRIGLLPLIPSAPNIFLVTGLNTIWGAPPHLGEVGFSYIFVTSNEIESYPSIRFGYRYEGIQGFLFKAAFTFIKSDEFFDTNSNIHRWFGISFGKVF